MIGFLKGKSAIAIAREFGGKQWSYTGEHSWVRCYAISTVGYDEQKIRKYVREHEVEDEQSSAQGAF